MKLAPLIQENKDKVTHIALDQDGVLADFATQYTKYLANDQLWLKVMNSKKLISGNKLRQAGFSNKEQFIQAANKVRKEAMKLSGDSYEHVKRMFKQKLGVNPAWKLVMAGKAEYWSGMDWMPGGQALVKYVRTLGIPLYILTAGAGDYPKVGKQQWLKKHGLGDLPFYIVNTGKEKGKYGKKGHLLIDDKKENVDGFKSSGGMGILYKSTSQTIAELKKYL